MNEVELTRLIQKRQESFIETRAQIANEVDTFLESIETADEDVQARIGVNKGARVKDYLPELWSEPFNPEVYEQQLNEFNKLVERVHSICDEINREALECLKA